MQHIPVTRTLFDLFLAKRHNFLEVSHAFTSACRKERNEPFQVHTSYMLNVDIASKGYCHTVYPAVKWSCLRTSHTSNSNECNISTPGHPLLSSHAKRTLSSHVLLVGPRLPLLACVATETAAAAAAAKVLPPHLPLELACVGVKTTSLRGEVERVGGKECPDGLRSKSTVTHIISIPRCAISANCLIFVELTLAIISLFVPLPCIVYAVISSSFYWMIF